ncbi:MAG: hypothetical protein GY822_05740 [Deltaproteobacteria bacterium]|nr:hypothetical protein [Deltaproteobacteria bacterium]
MVIPIQKLSVENASVQGDATIQLDKEGTLNLELNASHVDITLSDLISRGSTDLDLGKTQVRGSGLLNLQSGSGTAADGLHLSGNLQVDGVIDDLQVRDSSEPDASVILDVRADSRLGGQLRQLNLPSDGPLSLDAMVSVDGGLERLSVDNGSLKAVGSGSLQGAARLLLQDGNLQIDQSSLRASLNVQDANIAPSGGAFELDVAAGATLGLELQQLSVQDASTTKIQLGAGSFLSGSLDSGHLEMNGQRLNFDSNTRVDFSVQSVVSDDDGTSLRGQLKLNVGAGTDLPTAFTQGLPTDALVQGQLVVDDVQLNPDGTFALNDVQLTLDGQLGSVDAAQSAQNNAQSTAPTSLRGLLDAHPDVNTHQDLINLLHAQNGGTFDGAARGAQDVGLSINDLVAERGAMVSDLLSDDVVIAPLDLVSVSDVKASSAAELIDLKMPTAQALNPATLADPIESGSMKMNIPVSGDVGDGSWLGSATFPAGTVLEIEAAIVAGRIDPGQLQATFSNPGDGPAWVTVNGVYLNADHTLRLDLGGMVDFALPGMENLPMEVSDLLQQLTPEAPAAASGAIPTASASTSSSTAGGVQLGALSFEIDNIKLQGDLPTANANLTLGENTSLSLHGDLNEGRLFGQVEIDNASINGGDIALQGATGEASFELSYQRTDSGLQSVLTIEGAQLQVDALGQRGDNGDFVHLENANTYGRIVVETNFDTDAGGLPTSMQSVNTDAVLHQVEGDLVGARVSVPVQDGSMQQVELGPSSFSGNLSVDDNALSSLNGNVNDLVAQLNGGDLQVGGQAISVDNARLVGTGDIHFDGGAVSVSDADVALLVVRSRICTT